ncbi:hypothetical protein [Azospirillum palustre]
MRPAPRKMRLGRAFRPFCPFRWSPPAADRSPAPRDCTDPHCLADQPYRSVVDRSLQGNSHFLPSPVMTKALPQVRMATLACVIMTIRSLRTL